MIEKIARAIWKRVKNKDLWRKRWFTFVEKIFGPPFVDGSFQGTMICQKYREDLSFDVVDVFSLDHRKSICGNVAILDVIVQIAATRQPVPGEIEGVTNSVEVLPGSKKGYTDVIVSTVLQIENTEEKVNVSFVVSVKNNCTFETMAFAQKDIVNGEMRIEIREPCTRS